MANFPLTHKISQSSSRTIDQAAVIQKYADGYEQRFVFGRNSMETKFNITLSGLTESERNTLEAFYRSHGRVNAFTMTAPNDTVSRSWVFESSLTETNNANLYFFTFTIREVFE